VNWEDKAFIESSRNRKAILIALKNEPMMVTQLAKKLNNHRSTVSQQLIQLEKHGFVECKTPKRKNYRIYGLTKKGDQFS
jgi:predicted transcriptional regulator